MAERKRQLTEAQIKALRVIGKVDPRVSDLQPRESWINGGTFRWLLAKGLVERMPDSGEGYFSPMVRLTEAGRDAVSA